MQIHYPHRPIYTDDSLSLTPPPPTILQQRLATPPTSPEAYTPPVASTEAANKRLRNSKSFPLISATNRINAAPAKTRSTEEKSSNDVFESSSSRSSKSLGRKESRGILRDDLGNSKGADRGSRLGAGLSERGLKKKTSFQKGLGGRQVRLKRSENSTRSLRSEFQLKSGTPPKTNVSRTGTRRDSRQEAQSTIDDSTPDFSEEEVVLEVQGRVKESKSCGVDSIQNSGMAPIPRSHSDPLSSAQGPVLDVVKREEHLSQNAEDSDDEAKKHDPREVFSKERFLRRHSRDFGHLHAHLATTTMSPGGGVPITVEEPEDTMEQLVSAVPEVDLAAARREGREKRRSWALYRAGLVSPVPSAGPEVLPSTPHSAPAASASHAIGGAPNPAATGRAGHHRRLSSFVTGAHHPSLASPASSDTITAGPPSALPRQKVMSGGFKPLTLVAVTKGGSPGSPADAADRSHRRSRWSICSSGTPPAVEKTVPGDEIEELSIIEEGASEKSRGSIVRPRHSGQSRASLSSLPAHLRTHSSSTTSSSLSSLGAIINNGSPSKSSSSCSSGGEHLGGPRVLSGEAFNFRMSVGSRRQQRISLEDAFETTGYTAHGDGNQSYSGTFGFRTLQTDSSATLRGGRYAPKQVDPEVALASDDKHARAVRRRARAFLVAGLKLEEGSLFREEASVHVVDHNQTDASKRGGVVIEQPPALEDAPILRESKTRKRYSMMRAEKTTPQHVERPAQAARGTLATRSSNPSLVPRDGDIGSAASSTISYHTALEGRISDAPASETSSIHRDVLEMLDEHVQSANHQDRHSVSPITSSSASTTGRSPEIETNHQDSRAIANGIMIAVYDPMGHARQPSLSSYQDSVVPERPSVTRDNSQGSSSDHHSDEREMDSLELERRLFFNHPLNEPPTMRSVRKVKSDFGLSAGQIALPHGRSMSRPTSPVIIHEDAAGASPGRPTKTNWSKGVRQWWRDETKADAENETERGFGLGRGGDESKIPVSSLPPETGQAKGKMVNAPAATPNPPLKEKRSWQPFLTALTGGKDRILEKVSQESLVPSRLAQSLRRASEQESIPQATPIMTLDPPFMERSLEACSAESTPGMTTISTPSTSHWLSPLPLPMPLTARTRDRYSPFSATSFSPQTPEHHIKSPGIIMRASGIHQDLRQPLGQPALSLDDGKQTPFSDSRNILSPTPGISPNEPLHHRHNALNATDRLQPSVFMSPTGLGIQPPAPIHLSARKVKSMQDLHASSLEERTRIDEQGRDTRGPLHGLGLHVGWAEDVNRKGKEKANAIADDTESENKLHHQASQLLQLRMAAQNEAHLVPPLLSSSLGRRPAVGILTSAALSPTTSQSPTMYRSPSATTVGEPWKADARPEAVAPRGDEDTMLDSSITPIYHSPACGRMANPSHRDSQAMINMHCRELQPAKLFFLLGFLLGPWVWLLGGWALSPAGYFSSSTNAIHLGLSWQHAQAARLRRQTVSPASASTSKRPMLPPMTRDEPDKWVKRNRWAAVASAGIFIPAMCVGFASIGALL